MTVDHLGALHEAAHATVATMYGFSVKHAVLHPVGMDPQGYVELRDHLSELDEDAMRYLVFKMSGAAAEHRQCGQYSKRDVQDLEDAVTAAAVVLEQARDSPRVAQLVRDAQLLANSLMLNDDLWRWTRRVAAALIQHRRLTGRQIAELREATC
jgi:hypothetical protein